MCRKASDKKSPVATGGGKGVLFHECSFYNAAPYEKLSDIRLSVCVCVCVCVCSILTFVREPFHDKASGIHSYHFLMKDQSLIELLRMLGINVCVFRRVRKIEKSD